MTLPVSLAAAAVTLRKRADLAETAPMHPKKCTACVRLRAVADLIDGTLARYDSLRMMQEAGRLTEYGKGALVDLEVGLTALVPLVRAFLPDWNPDTEETP